jgi:hypothetical protein
MAAPVGFTKITVVPPGDLTDHEVPLAQPTSPASLAGCAAECMLDNNMEMSGGNWASATNTYYGKDGSPTPSYRCAGFTFDTKCTYYDGQTLPLVADAHASAADASAASADPPATVDYYDMNCMNSGTRHDAGTGGAHMDYCLCGQPQAVPSGESTNVLFEGERCTVPVTFHHTTNLHGSFNQYTDPSYSGFQHSTKGAAHNRWSVPFATAHPSGGLNVEKATGMPYPLIAGDPNPTTPVTAGAAAPGPDPSKTPPVGGSYGTSMSGQCGASAACRLRDNSSTCHANQPSETCTKSNDSECCNACCPDGTSAENHGLAVGAAAAPSSGIVKPPSLTQGIGTKAGPAGWCTQSGDSGQANCSGQNCDTTTLSGGACTSEPKSFETAAKVYQDCVQVAKAMVHQAGQSAKDVTSWNQANQNSLAALLGSSGKCNSQFHSGSKKGGGLSWSPFCISGAGGLTNHTDATAVNCEALFGTAQALSEYTATNTCVLNSATSCQATSICNDQTIDAQITNTGEHVNIDINQKATSNVAATSNYTTEFTNHITNTTQQSMEAVVKQVNKQLLAHQSQMDAIIVSGGGGDLPQQGPRDFASYAMGITSLTNSAVSNQIKNSQVTEVVQNNTLKFNINNSGAYTDIKVNQISALDAQVTEVTRNAVDNQLANTTVQSLTTNTDQDNEDKRSGIIMAMIIVVVVLVVGGVAALVFLIKAVAKKGKKLLEHHDASPPAAAPTPRPA